MSFWVYVGIDLFDFYHLIIYLIKFINNKKSTEEKKYMIFNTKNYKTDQCWSLRSFLMVCFLTSLFELNLNNSFGLILRFIWMIIFQMGAFSESFGAILPDSFKMQCDGLGSSYIHSHRLFHLWCLLFMQQQECCALMLGKGIQAI